MAYSDYNNVNFFPTSFAPEEADWYPFLGQTSAIEESGNHLFNTLANGWGMEDQLGPMASSSTSLQATAGYGEHYCNLFVDWCLMLKSPEPLPPVIENNGYPQPSYSSNYWPAIGQQTQYHHSGCLGWNVPFAGAVAQEASTAAPAPSSSRKYISHLKH